MKTLSEQLECAQLELSRPREPYGVECMEAIVVTLEKLKMLEEIGDEMKAQYRKNNPPKSCECCGADIESGTKCENCEDVLVI